MRPAALSLPALLDEGVQGVRRAGRPWLGVLWLGLLPLRFLQVYFYEELIALGDSAKHYGEHLFGIALATLAAFVVALAARLVYVRACAVRDRTVGEREVWRVAPADVATYVCCALVLEVLFWATAPMLILAPLFITAAGVAAGLSQRDGKPALLRPWVELWRALSHIVTVSGLMLVFAVALAVAWINLYLALQLVVWLMDGAAGDSEAWARLLRPWSERYFPLLPAEPVARALLLAGASMAVEPFWLSSHAAFVRAVRARQSGEDLKAWFRSIAKADARQ